MPSTSTPQFRSDGAWGRFWYPLAKTAPWAAPKRIQQKEQARCSATRNDVDLFRGFAFLLMRSAVQRRQTWEVDVEVVKAVADLEARLWASGTVSFGYMRVSVSICAPCCL